MDLDWSFICLIGAFPDLPKPATVNGMVFILGDVFCEVAEYLFRTVR
jgi:hypothetical protein